MTTPTPRREMSFLDHFDELRRRLVRAVWGLVLAFAAVSFYLDDIMAVLVQPYYQFLPADQRKLAYTGITDIFFVYMKIAAVLAVFAASPWIFYQIWAFIAPGLKPREKRWAIPFVLSTSFFFLLGLAFCYLYVLPFTFQFFHDFNKEFTNVVTLDYFWGFELKFLLGLGLVFETPVLIFLLTRLGIVRTGTLLKQWRWVIVGSFLLSAVITPSGDPVTQTIVAVPIIALYGVGLLVSWLFRRREDPAAVA
jgi:sec-independent protein translocase protein TatC